jgi:hypothetical protein
MAVNSLRSARQNSAVRALRAAAIDVAALVEGDAAGGQLSPSTSFNARLAMTSRADSRASAAEHHVPVYCQAGISGTLSRPLAGAAPADMQCPSGPMPTTTLGMPTGNNQNSPFPSTSEGQGNASRASQAPFDRERLCNHRRITVAQRIGYSCLQDAAFGFGSSGI